MYVRVCVWLLLLLLLWLSLSEYACTCCFSFLLKYFRYTQLSHAVYALGRCVYLIQFFFWFSVYSKMKYLLMRSLSSVIILIMIFVVDFFFLNLSILCIFNINFLFCFLDGFFLSRIN